MMEPNVNACSRILAGTILAGWMVIRMVLAFPGAEGFGANSLGGRGGSVIEVTNLNDSGAGSLRAAIDASGARTVVFRIGGTIVLNSHLEIRNPFITIAGQTAPGGGIALRANPAWTGRTKLIEVSAHDVIIRYIRVRPGKLNSGIPVGSQQAIEIGDFSENVNIYNVILDHVSGSWGIDGVFQTSSTVHDVTIQWCIISEGLNDAEHDGVGTTTKHARALNHYVGGGSAPGFTLNDNKNMSVHHNLMSHVQFRVPQVSTKLGMVEVIANVVYHTTTKGANINAIAHSSATEPPGASVTRWINNRFLRIPTGSNADIAVDCGDGSSPSNPFCDIGTLVHTSGNIGATRTLTSQSEDMSLNAAERSRWRSDPTLSGAFPYPGTRVTEETSAQAVLEMISGTGAFSGQSTVGATLPTRDSVDARILSQLTTYMVNPGAANTVPVPGGPNGGLLDDPAQVGGYPSLAAGTAPTDTDHDGIPDSWETAHGLNPNDASDRNNIAPSGYTWIEEYLNSLVSGVSVPPPSGTIASMNPGFWPASFWAAGYWQVGPQFWPTGIAPPPVLPSVMRDAGRYIPTIVYRNTFMT